MSPARKIWASTLAAMLSPHNPAECAKPLALLLPFLDDFPDAAFTVDSAKAVARVQRYGPVPSYDAVAKAMRAWWRDNRPHLVALPAPRIPDWPEPTEAEHAAVSATVAAFRAELVAAPFEPPPPPPRPACLSDEQLALAYQQAGLAGPRGRPTVSDQAHDTSRQPEAAGGAFQAAFEVYRTGRHAETRETENADG